MTNLEDKGRIACAVADAIREALKSVKGRYPEAQIMFDGCIEIDGQALYKPDWGKE
jgi:hypothetical protein